MNAEEKLLQRTQTLTKLEHEQQWRSRHEHMKTQLMQTQAVLDSEVGGHPLINWLIEQLEQCVSWLHRLNQRWTARKAMLR